MPPPRKEPKEAVVYPASKRKAPPFKPQRPSQVPRVASTEVKSAKPTKAARPTTSVRKASTTTDDEDEDEEEMRDRAATACSDGSDSDEELDEDPLAAKQRKPVKSTKPAPAKRKPPRRASPMSISSEQEDDASPSRASAAHRADSPPSLTQIDGPSAIPQPLLVRLMHEHFANNGTKIDKHAIQIVQKYLEVFIREAVARAQLQKKEEAEKGAGAGGADVDMDVNWLELEDLDKVAAGLVLDF